MVKIDINNVPNHIAFIMDGNGRWAKKKFMPRNLGHKAGVEALKGVITECSELNVKYITMYAFSTENWNRPEDEVTGLMKLLLYFFDKEMDELNRNNVRIMTIGDLSKFSTEIQETLLNAKEITENNDGINVVLALNYGSRDEIVRACKTIAGEVASGNIDVNSISIDYFSSKLDTAGMPDPDLVVRTSGELRLSNFMLWQNAYAEYYATSIYWPDFKKEELYKAIAEYQSRNRRFGKV